MHVPIYGFFCVIIVPGLVAGYMASRYKFLSRPTRILLFLVATYPLLELLVTLTAFSGERTYFVLLPLTLIQIWAFREIFNHYSTEAWQKRILWYGAVVYTIVWCSFLAIYFATGSFALFHWPIETPLVVVWAMMLLPGIFGTRDYLALDARIWVIFSALTYFIPIAFVTFLAPMLVENAGARSLISNAQWTFQMISYASAGMAGYCELRAASSVRQHGHVTI